MRLLWGHVVDDLVTYGDRWQTFQPTSFGRKSQKDISHLGMETVPNGQWTEVLGEKDREEIQLPAIGELQFTNFVRWLSNETKPDEFITYRRGRDNQTCTDNSDDGSGFITSKCCCHGAKCCFPLEPLEITQGPNQIEVANLASD